MREIRIKSVAPIYAFAVAWLMWCLFLPMYKFWHFIFAVAIAAAASFAASTIFKDRIIRVPAPEEPPKLFTTGDPDIDAVIKEGAVAVGEMRRLKASINQEAVGKRIDEIIFISEKIIDNVMSDRKDLPAVKRFLGFYLPTTIKLLNAYDRMYAQGIDGSNITGTIKRIETMLDSVVISYKKLLDSMFADEALDIETDIKVMEGMLEREGLSARRDFKI